MVLVYETLSSNAVAGGYENSTTTLQSHVRNSKNHRILLAAGVYEANNDGIIQIKIGGKLAAHFDKVTATTDTAMSSKSMAPVGFFWKAGDGLGINITEAFTTAPKVALLILTIPRRTTTTRRTTYRRRNY